MNDTRSAPQQPDPTQRVGPYRRVRELGRGAYGVVYLATRDDLLPRQFALKVLLAEALQDAEALARFEREAQAARKIDDPGVVQVLHTGRAGRHPYYVMEYSPGLTLYDRIKLDGALLPEESARIVLSLAHTVSAAHAQGVIHRDLKPSNVILEDRGDGGPPRPRITDFGLARDRAQSRLTQTGQLLGTPAYMSPEQLRGQKDLDHRVDVYALGVILYECLTGRRPFLAPTLVEVGRLVQRGACRPPSELVPEVPIRLEAICLQAMRTQRDHRHTGADELAEQLEEFLRSRAEPGPAPGEGSERRPPAPLVAGGVLLILCLALTIAWATRGSPAAERPATGSQEPPAKTVTHTGDDDAQAGLDEARQRREEVARTLLAVTRLLHDKASLPRILTRLGPARDVAREDPQLRRQADLALVRAYHLRGRYRQAIARAKPLRSHRGRAGHEARFMLGLALYRLERREEGAAALRALRRDDPLGPAGLSAASLLAYVEEGAAAQGERLARRAIAADPTYMEGRLCLVFALLNQRRYAEALRALRWAQKHAPGHPRTHVVEGLVRQGLRDWGGAEAALNRAIRLTEPRPMAMALQERAMIWRLRGDLPQALRDLKRAVQSVPDHPQALLLLGTVHEQLGQPALADEAWRTAAKRSPRQFERLLQRSVPKHLAQRIRLALDPRRANRAAQPLPKPPPFEAPPGALGRAVELARKRAPLKQVLAALDRAENEAVSSDAKAQVRLERADLLHRRGRYVQAIALCTKLAKRPGYVGHFARWLRGMSRIWQLSYREGLAELKGVWDADPDGPAGLTAGATWLSYNGRNPEGERLARRAIKLRPPRIDPYLSLAFCLNDQGRRADSLAVLTAIRPHTRDHPRAHMAHAMALAGLQRQKESLQAITQVIALTEPEPALRALNFRAGLAFRLNRYPEAARAASRYLERTPRAQAMLLVRGLARHHLGKPQAAAADWRAAAKLGRPRLLRATRGLRPGDREAVLKAIGGEK